jgi:hypothetical protein
MTQDERWMTRYKEVVGFIEINHRNPSKYAPEEKLMVHFLKHGRKLMNAVESNETRSWMLTIVNFRHDSIKLNYALCLLLHLFRELQKHSQQYKRKNQWEKWDKCRWKMW